MPPVSTKELIRFIPDSMKEQEDPPVFLIKTPTLRDKIALDACLAVEGVRYPANSELALALREGIKEHVIESDHPPLLEILEEYEAVSDSGQPFVGDLLERVEQIAKVLRPYHRPLGRIESERGRFLAMAMLIRAEMFLVNIEGKDVPKIEKRSGRITEECQEELETKYGAGTLFAIGARTLDVTTPTEEERKNLESPEPLPLDPEITTADPVPQTARRGKSSGNGIIVTPV